MSDDYTLRNGDKILQCTYSPRLYIKKASGKHLILPIDQTLSPSQIGLSPDGSTFVVSYSSAPFIRVYETVNWTQLSGMTEFPVYRALSIKFSDDSSMFALGLDNYSGVDHNLLVYKTSDLSRFPLPQVSDFITSDVNAVAFSPDGTMIAGGSSDNTDTVVVYNISDGSKITLTGISSSADCWCIDWSNDGSKIYYGSYVWTNSIQVIDTSTWTLTTAPSTNGYMKNIVVSPDGTKVAIAKDSTNIVELYNLPSWTLHSTLTIPVHYTINGTYHSSEWIDDNNILVCTGGSTPGYILYDVATGDALEQDFVIYSMSQVLTMQSSQILYEINGTIDESLVADSWVATAYDYIEGHYLASTEFTGTSFSIKLNRNEMCSVTVSAKQGDMWEPSMVGVNVGDKVVPTTPSTIPYYYIATIGGNGDVTEPVWPVTPSSTVVDGSITWELVEKLIQPVTHSPIIPTVVV